MRRRWSLSISSPTPEFEILEPRKRLGDVSRTLTQKQLRLREARRLMLVERVDVGAAGYAVGYQNPSRVSREYSRLYGKPTLRDIGGLRPAAAG